MITKKKILESNSEQPDFYSANEFIDRIILLDKIETGLEQVKKKNVTEDKDLDNKLSKWLD